jgi:hypothetical protein
MKVNSQLTKEKIEKLQMLFKEFNDVFAWIYKDLKSIPPELAQHIIELDTSIPPAHQVRYRLNPNYVVAIKHDINKLLVARIIQETTCLSLIMVVFKNNGKFIICVDFMRFNKAIKKILILCHFLMKY